MTISVTRVAGRSLTDRERDYRVTVSLNGMSVTDTFRQEDDECAVAFENWLKEVDLKLNRYSHNKKSNSLRSSDLPVGMIDKPVKSKHTTKRGYNNVYHYNTIVIELVVAGKPKKVFTRMYGEATSGRKGRSRDEAIQLCSESANNWITSENLTNTICLFNV